MSQKTGQRNPQSLVAEQIIREPLDKPTVQTPVGRVFVVPERCKGCKYCWEYCPEEVLEASKGINGQGYHYPQVKQGKESACINCGMCEWICPDFAIYAVEKRKVGRLASNIRKIRWTTQLSFLVLFLFVTTGTVCTAVFGKGFAFSEPLGVLQLVFTQALKPNAVFSFLTLSIIGGVGIFVGITVLFGRAFCSWACPLGTVIDGIDAGLEKLKFKPVFTRSNPFAGKNRADGLVRNGVNKYALLGGALTSSAIFKYPVWCAFCPIGTLCRGAIAGTEVSLGAELLALPAVGAMNLGEKRFFCKYVCPVGGFLTILSRYNIFIKPKMRDTRHRNCGICTKICPEGINLCQEKSFAKCTKCLDCYAKCPSGSVSIRLT